MKDIGVLWNSQWRYYVLQLNVCFMLVLPYLSLFYHICIVLLKFCFPLEHLGSQNSRKNDSTCLSSRTCRKGLMTWCFSAELGSRVSFSSAAPMSFVAMFVLFYVIVSELPEPLSFIVIWDLSLSAAGHSMMVTTFKKYPKGAYWSFAFSR